MPLKELRAETLRSQTLHLRALRLRSMHLRTLREQRLRFQALRVPALRVLTVRVPALGSRAVANGVGPVAQHCLERTIVVGVQIVRVAPWEQPHVVGDRRDASAA